MLAFVAAHLLPSLSRSILLTSTRLTHIISFGLLQGQSFTTCRYCKGRLLYTLCFPRGTPPMRTHVSSCDESVLLSSSYASISVCFRVEAPSIIFIYFRFHDGEMGIEYSCQLTVAFPLEVLIPIYQYRTYLGMKW